ncbi:hypothetical protein IEQ34_017630 [Dendrobium chrysotoxum]|uniref:Uncharacterized protein n=1 Tax=Dendrobium chrysotoxum TaxID=161865 RepID=A0AAV7GAR6_DENCH|nr:hypothetical protein IEQ34_017630 [Dendrobium chrysotoxum]
MDLASSSSSKIAEKEVQIEKTLTNGVEAHDIEFIEKELFSIENSAYHEQGIAEGLKVETEQPLDNQFDSSLVLLGWMLTAMMFLLTLNLMNLMEKRVCLLIRL